MSAHKSLEQFIHDAQAAFPVLARTLSGYTDKLRTEPGFPHRGQKVFDLTLKLCERLGLTYDDLLDSYAEFCFTFLREQEQFRTAVLESRLLRVRGRVERAEGVVHLLAERLDDLTSLIRRLRTASRDFH